MSCGFCLASEGRGGVNLSGGRLCPLILFVHDVETPCVRIGRPLSAPRLSKVPTGPTPLKVNPQFE